LRYNLTKSRQGNPLFFLTLRLDDNQAAKHSETYSNYFYMNRLQKMPWSIKNRFSGNYSLAALLIYLLLLSSCISTKDLAYFQESEESASDTVPQAPTSEPIIQHNDMLSIHVASINMEASRFFNPTSDEQTEPGTSMTNYLVGPDGEIEMPLIGRVKVSGLTTKQTRDTLKMLLEKYLESPTIRVYLESFKITILGEVKLPGVYYIRNEKVAVPEALGLAGDMTIYGDRTQVQVIREGENQKFFIDLDMTTRDVFLSEGYNLKPNDILYVPAGKGRLASIDNFYKIAPIVISALTLFTLIGIRF
jgi:polysaccharide biosynthesis/export protein